MILKLEIEKASEIYAKTLIFHPTHRAVFYTTAQDEYDEICDSFKKGFEFRDWLQNNWFYTGFGWVKNNLPELGQEQFFMDELIEIFLKGKERSNDDSALPISDVSLSVCPKCGCELFYAERSKKWMCSLETCDWQTGS
jgi:hypothetical protein